MPTIQTIPGTREFGERLAACEINFAATLAEKAAITTEDAYKVMRVYLKQRLLKIDTTNKTYRVKHGGFLDPEVIGRALAYAVEKGI